MDDDVDPVEQWMVDYIHDHPEQFHEVETSEDAINVLTDAARAHFASDTLLCHLMSRGAGWACAAERAISEAMDTGDWWR